MRLVPLFLLLVSAGLLIAQQHSISVDGEAEVQVVPDYVVIALGVESQGKSAGEALAANAGVIKRLVDMARKSGIPDGDLKTDFIQFQVQHAQGSSIPIEFYIARKSLVVTLRDLRQFEPFLTAALTAGATHLHGVDFRTSELRKYRDQAREMAVKAAAEKARDLAKTLGRTVGPQPIEINSFQTENRSWYGSGWSSAWNNQRAMMQNVSVVADSSSGSANLDGSVAFGRISVTARVTARFAIE